MTHNIRMTLNQEAEINRIWSERESGVSLIAATLTPSTAPKCKEAVWKVALVSDEQFRLIQHILDYDPDSEITR